MPQYNPRCIEKRIQDELNAFGAVLIVGPKWCGKTTTAKLFAKSMLDLADPKETNRCIEIAKMDLSVLLEGDNPRLIDEWQIIPEFWDAIRNDVDKRSIEGLYVLTGSNTVNRSKIKHSGIGRMTELKMMTMSLFESGESSGSVSMSELFSGADSIKGESDASVTDIARMIVRGGWPGIVGKKDSVSDSLISGYCETLLKEEISTVDGKNRDPKRMQRIMKSLARNESTETANTLILADVIGNGNYSMSINTLDDYIKALEALYVIDNMTAWCPQLRSKTAVRTSDVRHFIDPSIGAYFLGATAKDLVNDPKTYGLYFESLVVRDLRIYACSIKGTVSHYRDGDGLEADAVVHLKDGRWAALEVKKSHADIEEGAKKLLKLMNKVDTDVEGKPSFLAVIVPNGIAYRRNDGVFVIPIGCLRD